MVQYVWKFYPNESTKYNIGLSTLLRDWSLDIIQDIMWGQIKYFLFIHMAVAWKWLAPLQR